MLKKGSIVAIAVAVLPSDCHYNRIEDSPLSLPVARSVALSILIPRLPRDEGGEMFFELCSYEFV